ncbi:MAG: tetratricopeptide repeat protein [Emcibacter sp.]|nr:tetratricopeptide repeat protein [Emcibacter sp.]
MIKITRLTKALVSATALGGVMLGLVATATIAPVMTGISGQAFAASTDKDKRKYEDRKTRRTPALSEKIYKVLGKAQECADANDFVCAMQVLEDGLGYKLQKLNSYERAQYYNFKGFLYYSQEKYGEALKAYGDVLRQENLPSAMEDTTVYTMAQLYFIKEDYNGSIRMMLRWLEYQPAPTAQPLVLLGQAYYSLGTVDGISEAAAAVHFNKGIPYIMQAVELYKASGKQPKENWYLLLRVMYFEMKENQKVVDILELLVNKWPKKDYWLQLAGMYGEMSSDAKSEKTREVLEKKQLATYETAYRQGFLAKGSELVNMSQLYMYHEAPYWASVVLEKGMKSGVIEKNKKSYENLAQARINAQDMRQSLVPLRIAAELSKNGELYKKLGQVYMQLDDYKNAAKYLGSALKKGGLKRRDTAAVYQGMCYFNLSQLDKARKSFEIAAKDKRSRKQARKWISYLTKEKKRLKQIKEFLG